MRHIPRIILTHSVTYYGRTGIDAYNKPTYSTGAAVSFVRCEPVKHNAFNDTGESKDDKLTLFYDCVNSEPITVVPKNGDKVNFLTVDYIAREVKDFSPYHYEVILK